MDVTNKNKVFESLKNNEIDFGLVSFLPSLLDVDKLDLLQDKLYLVGKRETNQQDNVTAKKMFENLNNSKKVKVTTYVCLAFTSLFILATFAQYYSMKLT